MRTKLFSVAGFAMLVGMTMVSCQSKDLYDESTIQENEAHKRVAKYEDAFTRTFGQVAANHRWGFDQTTGAQTRTAVTSTHDYWIIPENFLGGSENKEGWNANALAGILTSLYDQKDVAGSGVTSSLSGFDFSNYFLQHVEKVQGGNIKNSIKGLQAYNSDTKEWEYVTNFVRGDNPNGVFTVSAEGTYFYAPINSSAKGTTLMTEMGGDADSQGHLFRIVYDEADEDYNYDYCFLTTTAYHKEQYGWVEGEHFLAFKLPGKNKNSGPSYWVIRLGEGTKAQRNVKAEGRVLCEDMGANDFDFNDVVFDAYIMKNGDLKITVLAHGGQLDIKVAGVPVTLGKMTNTGVNSDATQTINIPAASHNYTSIEEIPVEVFPNGFADNLNHFPLESITGQVPQKICAPIGTNWPDEYVKISDAYTSFNSWVTESNPARWTFITVPRFVDLKLSNNGSN